MDIDLVSILAPEKPPLEIIVRGSITYFALFALLRLTLKRQSASLRMTDLLVVVLIADAAQNAMAADYSSVSDGLLLVVTILVWAYALDWLGYHVRRLEWIVHPGPLPLIEDGRLLRRNMREELITREELLTQLRLQGIEDVGQVRRAYLEGNGELSVVPRGDGDGGSDGSAGRSGDG